MTAELCNSKQAPLSSRQDDANRVDLQPLRAQVQAVLPTPMTIVSRPQGRTALEPATISGEWLAEAVGQIADAPTLLEAATDSPSQQPSSWDNAATELSRQLAELDRPFSVRLDSSELLILPATWREQEWLVLGLAESISSTELATAQLLYDHLGLTIEAEQYRQDMDHYARQISRDFEELTFLQRMVDFLQLSENKLAFSEVVAHILNLLQPAVEAEALVFLADDDSTPACSPNKLSTVLYGQPLGTEAMWRQLLEAHPPATSDSPTVRNQLQDGDFPQLYQYVITPVTNHDQQLGWLLAVNRDIGVLADPEGTTDETEFGTFEASLMAAAASVLATYQMNRKLLHQRERLLIDMVQCLVSAIDAKDEYTRGHSVRVAMFARCLAEEWGLPPAQCEAIYMSGLLHDVGKIGVPDQVLNKPGPLTDDEYAEIRKHPDRGWAILHPLAELAHVLPGVVHHHEEFDGGGYPDKLDGEQIPLAGRLLAVVDAYDAITSRRSYRDGRSHEQAMAILRQGSGTQWDPAAIAAFERAAPKIEEIAASYETPPTPVRQPHSDQTMGGSDSNCPETAGSPT